MRKFFHLSLLSSVLLQPFQDPDRDLSKRLVELPLEAALPPSAPGAQKRVVPGLVSWHTDLEAACAAAELSHKPVLLFQLLGQLDEEFC